MSPAPEVTNAVNASLPALVVGAVSSLATVLLSKYLDRSAGDRRQAAEERRDRDRQARRELRSCETECDRLREYNGRLLADNAGLRATLIARGLALPPIVESVE